MTTDDLLAYLKAHGGILWEPGEEGCVGWAICPHCGERNLRIEVAKVQVLRRIEEDE